MLNSTERFSTRVGNYIKYRPSYPAGVLDLMRGKCGLGANSTVADVGSGTGLLTELLLRAEATVYGVEPNKEMRKAAEEILRGYPRFRSVDGAAEATTLPDRSVGLITSSQAFHWFDVRKTRTEFVRVLEPGKWVVLVWNERPVGRHAFMDDYDALLRKHAPDYDRVTDMRADPVKMRELFGREPAFAEFSHEQSFDYAGLEGRLMSSSFAPETGHPEHAPMISGLQGLFERHQRGGKVASLIERWCSTGS